MKDDTFGGIGGYFHLEIPKIKNYIYQGAIAFQSARAAFYALVTNL